MKTLTSLASSLLLCALLSSARGADLQWRHLSSKSGYLPAPNTGKQQTSATVFDIDGDKVNDFVITERTEAPAVVGFHRVATGWERFVIEPGKLRPEAGANSHDVDSDGDLDFVVGGDGQSDQIWWWENPGGAQAFKQPWQRHLIKDNGANKHHDLLFGDFDGDGKDELVFWNQGANKLFIAEVPPHPREAGSWDCRAIYSWSGDSEMQQRGTYPSFKAVNEHEGLDKADIDGDGKLDIVGGGRWFKHLGGVEFAVNFVDASYAFSRSAAGQLIEGGRPEIVLVVGDGVAPLMLYEWQKGAWIGRELVHAVDGGHSLRILDFDGDGHLDIWNAEMRLSGGNPNAQNRLLLGDGKGNFKTVVISSGFGLHESKIADLDGDGDLDILGKPYNWETPRLDVWLNEGAK